MIGKGERHRVVVTGLGLVTPLGNDIKTTWRNILAGQSGISRISKWENLDEMRVRYNLPDRLPSIAGEVKNCNFEEIIRERKINCTREDLKRIRQIDPFIA